MTSTTGVFVKKEVELPMLPNFLRAGNFKISVGDLTDEDIDILAVKWCAAMKEYAKRKREIRDL